MDTDQSGRFNNLCNLIKKKLSYFRKKRKEIYDTYLTLNINYEKIPYHKLEIFNLFFPSRSLIYIHIQKKKNRWSNDELENNQTLTI